MTNCNSHSSKCIEHIKKKSNKSDNNIYLNVVKL